MKKLLLIIPVLFLLAFSANDKVWTEIKGWYKYTKLATAAADSTATPLGGPVYRNSATGQLVVSTAVPLAASTYTPTGTNGTNVTSNTPGLTHYMRVGNEVSVDGYLSVVVTGAGDAVVLLDLPIASALTTTLNVIGQAANVTNHTVAEVVANATFDQASITLTAAAGGTFSVYYHYKYTVL